jgi:deazaflavin-dependent oxidoreductase (nitroreductase family)
MDERALGKRMERIAASRPGAWFYVNVAPHLDRALLRLTGGRLTTAPRVGFLEVKGAKSGVRRVTPLVYTRDGKRVLLVASRGGDVKNPAWYHNVVANPEVRFSADGQSATYRARSATDEERPGLWEQCVRNYSGYAVYQKASRRSAAPNRRAGAHRLNRLRRVVGRQVNGAAAGAQR